MIIFGITMQHLMLRFKFPKLTGFTHSELIGIGSEITVATVWQIEKIFKQNKNIIAKKSKRFIFQTR